MNRDEIIKAAENFSKELEWQAKHGICDSVNTERIQRAVLLRSLIALVPKDGEIVLPVSITFEDLRRIRDVMLKAAKEDK